LPVTNGPFGSIRVKLVFVSTTGLGDSTESRDFGLEIETGETGSYSVGCCWSPRIVYFRAFVMAGLGPTIHENAESCTQGNDNVT
jgi:hypothetical protein